MPKSLKLYRTPDCVFQTADGKECVSCPNYSCGKRHMKKIGKQTYRCLKCGRIWELQ